ncbi:MAG: hypothetical protein K6F52_04850 [Clostridia bacterium]|nr:hypothetical protein [Clostridia bacterium]
MMNEAYDIILKSPLGPKEGTLLIEATARRLRGTLKILGEENQLVGVHDKENFHLKGIINTAIGREECIFDGRLLGERNFRNLDAIGVNDAEVGLEGSISINGKSYLVSGSAAGRTGIGPAKVG